MERLAHHALRGEVWDKALAYGHQAGEKARTRSAYREAVVYFEQALAALAHLPESRAATEQAIDLRLGLHGALNALREAPERMLEHLRRAATLAETLGDQRRLGQVYAEMSLNCWVAGEVDRALVSGQRALALAATLGHVGLQAQAHLSLGRSYYDTGDYLRAVESFERNVATLQGDLLYEGFGSNNNIAASSRAWLSLCHAERGAFTEGLAMAEEGLRIAETVQNPFSLIEACLGVSTVYLRQGEVQRAIPMLERAMGVTFQIKWRGFLHFIWRSREVSRENSHPGKGGRRRQGKTLFSAKYGNNYHLSLTGYLLSSGGPERSFSAKLTTRPAGHPDLKGSHPAK